MLYMPNNIVKTSHVQHKLQPCVCLKEPTAVGHLEAKAMPVLKTAVEMSSHLKHI